MTGTKSPLGNRPSRPESPVTLLEFGELRDPLGFILTLARIRAWLLRGRPSIATSPPLGGEGRPQRDARTEHVFKGPLRLSVSPRAANWNGTP